MPDKKDQAEVVTDPAELAEYQRYLDSQKTSPQDATPQPEAVTDPNELAEYQKYLDSQNVKPDSGLKKNVAEVPAPVQQPSIATQFLQGKVTGSVQGGISVKQDDGTIITDHPTKGRLVETPQQFNARNTQEQTQSAHTELSSDIIDNLHNLPQSYTDNVNATSFTQPENIVNEITDPHGDPVKTGKYLQARIPQIQIQQQQAIAAYQQQNAEDKVGNPEAYQQGLDAINKQFEDKQNSLYSAAGHTIDLQLTAKDYFTDKNYDPVKIGIQKQALLGDPSAQKALVNYNNGTPLSPVDKYRYEAAGLNSMQVAAKNAAASGQPEVAAEIEQHSDNAQERLEKDNPEYFTAARAHEIGNYIAQNENKLYGTLFSHYLTQDDIDDAGKKLGYTKDQMSGITPKNVPSSSWYGGQVAQGITNTVAPIVKLAIDNAGVGVVPGKAPSFSLGQMQDKPYDKFFTGETPDYQNKLTISNPRSVVASMSSGVGGLLGFMATAESGGAILEGLGAGAELAATGAQFGAAAIPAYNDGYDRAVQMFGDSPEDEGKRQLYALTNGAIGGAVMMLDPQANLGRDILGVTKSGQSFSKMIKDGGLENITKPALENKYVQILNETAKHVGLQTSMAATQTAAGNLADMMFDPKGNHHLMDNVGESAMNGAVAMFLPSLVAGIMHPKNQTALNKGLMYDAGTNPYGYKKEIGSMVTAGKMTTSDAAIANDAIDKLHYIISNQVPEENLSGKPLSTEQKQNYAYNLLQDSELQKKLSAAESTNDKAQIDQVKGKITELASERNKMLDKAGEVTPVIKPDAPAQEKPDSEPADERSVATEPNQGQQPTEKKDSKTLGNTKEDVSLNTTGDNTGTSQAKTTENESSEINGGKNAEEGQRPDAENTGLKNSESRDEAGQDRPIESQKDNQTPAASTESAGEPVKKKRRFVNKERPEPVNEIPVEEEPALQTQDLGKGKGQPEEDTKDAIEQATVNNPDQPADVHLADNPKGETFNEAKDRVKGAWDKITAPESEGGEKDNTLLITHSWDMKLLDAVHKLGGWDHANLEEEHQNGSTKPGDLQSYKTEDGRTIWVARHGETEDNQNDLQRTDNTPLTEDGKDEARKIAEQLKEKGITPPKIITSDLPRAKETADIISEHLKPSQDASTQTKEQQQKSIQQGGEPEHARVEQAGDKETPASPTGSNSNKRSEAKKEVVKKLTPKQQSLADTKIGKYNAEYGRRLNKQVAIMEAARKRVNSFNERIAKEIKGSDRYKELTDANEADKALLQHIESKPPKPSTKNQSKIGNNTAQEIKERKEVFSKTPVTVEEWAKQELLKTGDNPEDKFELASVNNDLPTAKGSEERENIYPFVHKDGTKNLDQWANDIAGDPNRWPGGLNLSDANEIKETMLGLLSNYENKTDLRNDLLKTFRDRDEAEARWNDRSENDVAADAYVPDEINHTQATPEERAAEHEIDMADITDKDANIINNYLQTLLGKDGKIDPDKIDPVFDINHSKAYNDPELSASGRKALDLLYESNNPDQKENIINNLQQKKNEKGNRADAGIATEDASSGQGENAPPRSAENEDGIGKEKVEPDQTSEKPNEQTPGGIKEKPNQEKTDERSVATNSNQGQQPETKEPSHSERIAEIDLQLQKEHASQHDQGEKRSAAEKKGDIEAANKANANWYKKQDKIDRLNAERDELSRRQETSERENQVEAAYKNTADKLRAWADKSTKGSAIMGSFPGISPHFTKEFLHLVADGIEKFGHLHAGILEAINKFLTKHPEEKVKESDLQEIADNLPYSAKPLKSEPILHIANEEAAKDIISDINSGKMTYADAVKEVMDEDLSDKLKGKILNYIDWHTTERQERNDTTLDQKGWLNKHTISHSGAIRDYLSLQTDEDVYGAGSVKTKNTDYQETKIIEDLQKSGNDIFNQAQKKYAENNEPVEQWGAKFLGDINKLNMNGEDAGTKKVLALTALGNELQGQSRELETDIAKSRDAEKREFLENKKAKTDELLAKVQDSQANVLHDAAITLNAARVRRLFRNEHLFEMYEQKILSENEIKAKSKLEKAENETKISDDEVEEGVVASAKDEKQALADEKQASKDRAKKESEPKPTEQPKKKGIITRLRERGQKSKKTGEDTRGRISDDELAKGRVDENSLLQQIKDELKKQKPC